MRILGSVIVLLSPILSVIGGEHDGDKHALTAPPLHVIESIIISTAATDFARNTKAYEAASSWNNDRLISMADKYAPYLACATYEQGRDARSKLEDATSLASVRPLSHTKAHGACFVVTALPSEASAMADNPAELSLASMGPFLSNLKIAPGLFSYGRASGQKAKHFQSRLRTTYGPAFTNGRVRGLTVRLAPGVLASSRGGAATMFDEWRADFTSRSIDLWRATFWSDPDVRRVKSGRHPVDHEEGMKLAHDWTQAANLVHEVAAVHELSTGEVCGWHRVTLHLSDDELVVVEGNSPSISGGCVRHQVRHGGYSCRVENHRIYPATLM